MRLCITNNIGLWAATYVKNKIKSQEKKAKHTILGLPTGSTPLSMYQQLIKMCKEKELSFKDVITFNMDEYIGLSPEHAQSYNYYMHNNFFNHIDIAPENIHIPNGVAKDIKQECINYESKIKSAGKINLFVGGVGEDGHLGFNEPYSSLLSKTRDKDLTIYTRKANARFFNNIDEVPKKAITVGINTIMESEEVMILVSGYHKAKVVKNLIEGNVSHVNPISILQMHPKVIIVADDEACDEVKVRTYRYFKSMQDEFSNLLEE